MTEEEKEPKTQYGIVNFERRRSPRFSVDLPIEYSCVDSSGKSSGRTGNASVGGLMLFLGEDLKVGREVRIKIFFPSESQLDSIEVLAEVVWTEIAFGKEKDHRCGVRFIHIATEDLTKLKTFLDRLSTIRPSFRVPPNLQQESKP
jgi:c-di-GMP-binding flagellar brake protein YcgR